MSASPVHTCQRKRKRGKTMKKQILTALLLIAMVLAVAAGCTVDPGLQPAFPTEGLAAVLPQLEGTAVAITTDTADNFAAEVGGITPTQHRVYVSACKAAGLNEVLTQYDNTVVLSNKEGHMVTVEYEEDKQILSVDLYAPTVLPILDYEDFLGNNVSGGYVLYDLKLPTKLNDKKADIKLNLTWSCSNPDIVNEKGELTRLLTGDEVVILTATDESGAKKSFPIRVLGMDTNKGTLTVTGDYVPATGVGVEEQYTQMFTLNTNNNSIIADLGEKQKVNYVKLTDGDSVALLGTEFMTLWISDDNATYTQIKDYSLIQIESDWYLYGFEAEARYVKAHFTLLTSDGLYKDNYTASLPNEAEFKNAYGKIIRAGYEEVVGSNGAEFVKSSYTVTNNSERHWCDYAYTVPLADLGVTGNADTLRISVEGKPLYHYVDGINAVIRIPNLAKGASLTLDVYQSENASALNFANKQGVYEIVYGTREIAGSLSVKGAPRYSLRLYKGTKFPAGNVLEEDMIIGTVDGKVYQSTDGGFTWTVRAPYKNNAPEGGTPVTNMGRGSCTFIYDEISGRIYAGGHYKLGGEWGDGTTPVVMNYMYSDDGGLTWSDGPFLPTDIEESIYNLTAVDYWNGITVKASYDGKDGDGVDLLMPVAASSWWGDHYNGGTVRVAYSRDAGETWQYSDTRINYREVNEAEGDVSESTVIERDDGVLVLQVRCQHKDTRTFAVSYSLDHGVTWMSQAELSNVYSSNTQPIAQQFEVNGVNATMLSWASNNVNGNTYFYRNPMHIATSTNGGEIFRNIQNLLARTPYEAVTDRLTYVFATNQCFTKAGDDDMYMAFNCQDLPLDDTGSRTRMLIRVTDFDNWLTRTKGAYDSFEGGLPTLEGWSKLGGVIECSAEQVSDGKYSMKLKNGAQAFRSIPYLQNGTLSLDVFIDEETEFTMELQSALSLTADNKAAPVVYTVKDKKITFAGSDVSIDLKEGWNTLSFQLELTEDKAMFSANGAEAVAIPVDMSIGDYITFVAVYCESTAVYMDEFLVVSDLDAVIVATEEDKQAANVVIEQIKKMDATKASDVQAARAAFEALTQVQRDLVDSKVVVDPNGDINTPGTIVNYYDVLVEAEAKLSKAG